MCFKIIKMKRFVKIVYVLLLFISIHKSFSQVGINTTAPLSTLDLNGNLSVKTIGVTTPLIGGPSGSATLIDDGVYVSLTPVPPNNIQFYLNNPATLPGRVYILRNITDFDTAELYTAGGKRFFQKSSNVGTVVGAPIYLPPNSTGKSIIIISDGANWTYFD